MTDAARPECTAILSGISAYLDGELAATECAAIEGHCAGCADCAALVEGLRHTVGLCRDAGETRLPDAVLERARASVRRLLDDAARPRSG